MGCFPCGGSSDEEEEMMNEKKKKKVMDENGGRAGSTSKQQALNVPSVLRPCRVASGIAGRTFTFRELAAVTQNFQIKCLVGEGGFGAVYKGRLDTGQVVAVKRLDRNGLQGDREFDMEVKMLSSLHHQNLVKLIGYCSEGDQRLLVYEFMPLGSLEDHLHDLPPGKEPLDWNRRIKIAAGAARGIEYLHVHVKPPIIYRDLKASNILLDEGYFPKLSDFGLARSGPDGDRTHVSTRVMGTYGYCAPEYAMSGWLTVKSDIYSFGVLLLEIFSGRKALDYTRPTGEQSLISWARPFFRNMKNLHEMADPLLQGRYPTSGLSHALTVAALCVQEEAAARPTISEVVLALNHLVSHVYDPSAPVPRIVPTEETRENKKILSILSDNQPARQSLTHCSPDFQHRDLAGESDSGRGDGTGRMQDFNGSQMDELRKGSPVKKMREATRDVDRYCDRERAVAEAQLWGENRRREFERMRKLRTALEDDN